MTSTTASPSFTVAIIGAGIAGITLAIALSKQNPSLKLTIYESRHEFSQISAGVGFGPNAVRAMSLISPEVLAIYDKAKTGGFSASKDHVVFTLYHGHGPRSGLLFGDVEAHKGFRHCGASRAQFLEGLVRILPESVGVVFGKKVADVTEEEDGRMRVRFTDGEEVTAYVVLGCDGIRSACRRSLLGPDDPSAKAVYSGKYAYRAVLPMRDAVAAVGEGVRDRVMYCGEGGHVLLFPIAGGKMLNVVAFRASKGEEWESEKWVVPSSRQEVLRDFKD